jgi:hypothetical protein
MVCVVGSIPTCLTNREIEGSSPPRRTVYLDNLSIIAIVPSLLELYEL